MFRSQNCDLKSHLFYPDFLKSFKFLLVPLVLIKQGAHFHPISGKAHYKGKTTLRKLSPGFFSITISYYKPLKGDKR
jgi:hypothetical protein